MPFSAAPREKLVHRTTSQKILSDSSCIRFACRHFLDNARGLLSEFIIVKRRRLGEVKASSSGIPPDSPPSVSSLQSRSPFVFKAETACTQCRCYGKEPWAESRTRCEPVEVALD